MTTSPPRWRPRASTSPTASRPARTHDERFALCTTDEVKLAIAHKLATISHEELLTDEPVVDVLHANFGRIDFDVELDIARELLADDTDVGFLWIPALDGIEYYADPQHSFRIVNLRPSE